MEKTLIDLRGITKSFDGELILDDLNLSIRENSFVTLLGPSDAPNGRFGNAEKIERRRE